MPTAEQHEMELLRSRLVRLEAQVEFLYKHFGLTFSENAHLSDDPGIIDALRKNNMIEAIRLYRERKNVSLAEAKSAVEEIRRRRAL